MVKTAKNIMEKAEESRSDPHLSMLIYKSTPIIPGQLSPADRVTHPCSFINIYILIWRRAEKRI